MCILQIRPTPPIASASAAASLRKATPRPAFDEERGWKGIRLRGHEVCELLEDKRSESHEEKGSSLGLVRDATKVNQQLDFDYVL